MAPTGLTDHQAETSAQAGDAPEAETDPYLEAVAGIYQRARTGDPKAIRMLTDGTLGRLKDLAGGTPSRPSPRDIIRGEVRTPCPGCGHRLLVTYCNAQGWAELSVLDLTTTHDLHPAISQGIKV